MRGGKVDYTEVQPNLILYVSFLIITKHLYQN